MATLTPVVTLFTGGSTPALLATFAGSAANGDVGVIDSWNRGLNWVPTRATLIITTSVGTTAAIDVDVDVSMDNNTYVVSDINNITAKDTYEHHPADGASDDSRRPWRYWKVSVVTVGAGNTLSHALFLAK